MANLQGDEPFHSAGEPLPFTVADFWRWGLADLTGNVLRGVVAEFLVARAIGAAEIVRVEWDAVDLLTARGTPLEVKCSGYVQAWPQRAPSRPSFDIAPKRGWHAATNTYEPIPVRPASLYVFALHHHLERATVDARDVRQWSFFVVSTSAIAAKHATTKRLSLAGVNALAVSAVGYEDLAARISDVEATLAAG